jgi:hypothetical protein
MPTPREAMTSTREIAARLTPTRGLSSRAPGLRLFGVAALDAGHGGAHAAPLAPGTELVTFRDVGAVVASAPFGAEALAPEDLEQHRAVVEHVFAHRAIVPAPPGAVFRSRDALASWLELHYFTLVEALNFVEARAVARVTVRRGPLAPANAPAGEPGSLADLASDAADTLRALRKGAVALVVVREGDGPGDAHTAPAVHASYLVERAQWGAFVESVSREGERRRDLQLACTGPWPPYDFVRMQLAG